MTIAAQPDKAQDNRSQDTRDQLEALYKQIAIGAIAAAAAYTCRKRTTGSGR